MTGYLCLATDKTYRFGIHAFVRSHIKGRFLLLFKHKCEQQNQTNPSVISSTQWSLHPPYNNQITTRYFLYHNLIVSTINSLNLICIGLTRHYDYAFGQRLQLGIGFTLWIHYHLRNLISTSIRKSIPPYCCQRWF